MKVELQILEELMLSYSVCRREWSSMEDGGDLLQCVEESVALLVWGVEVSGAPLRMEEKIYSNAWRKVLLCMFGVLKRVELH